MVSPRRSSRARSSTHAVNSSSSSQSHSASSSRSRHTRNRTDDADAGTSFDDHNDANTDAASVAEDQMDDTGSQEDEITRCICGYQEYQGGDDDSQSDTDGLFIQCDECSVWQHGYCVGITDADATPENYYCEKCKPELHREGVTKAGMKTSIYIPAQPSERERERERKSSLKETQKRRTTMNSRDAEYDDEVLKRMIEISKKEAKQNEDSSRSSRGRKRGSSEGSDEVKDSKRLRTSHSPEQSSAIIDSDNEKPPKTSSSSKKKSSNKHTASASKTNGSTRTSARNRIATEKAEPKKDVEPEPAEEVYPPKKTTNNRTTTRSTAPEEPPEPTPPVVELAPDTPPPVAKRPARNAANGNRRRAAHNRNAGRQSEDPHEMASPMSRDHSHPGHSTRGDPTAVIEKPIKPRPVAARMTLNEMKRRVNGISDYITRTQVEMANSSQSDIFAYMALMEKQGTPITKSTPHTPKECSQAATPTSGSENVPRIEVTGESHRDANEQLEKATEALTVNSHTHALDIMEMLSAKINRWQQNYGELAI